MGGSTTTPTAKSQGGTSTEKAMADHPGTMGGHTTMPTAKGDAGSLSDKVMKDEPGTH
jgi:hypothetical protein